MRFFSFLGGDGIRGGIHMRCVFTLLVIRLLIAFNVSVQREAAERLRRGAAAEVWYP